MTRDPLYRDIVNALDARLDAELFERCAADLLRAIYPGLVPVRGGTDAGMDGAIADISLPPLPLVTTTSPEITRNLRRSLRSYAAAGGQSRRAVLATSRPLSGPRRLGLERVAREEGFVLLQAHDQAAFADLLYRSPAWCLELLNLTGDPPALATIPVTSRPLLGDQVIGRDDDLEWISSHTGDALLVGQPGSGKTFILAALARSGLGLFAVNDSPAELARAVRQLRPEVIFVDDAHHRIDLLQSLRQLRSSMGAEFRILATSWPGEAATVARVLELGASAQRRIALLSRAEIALVIRTAGIAGPARLVGEIIDQAKGLPGLAVTLTLLCLSDGVKHLATGAALFADVRETFQRLVGREAVEILAAFALGGSRGMTFPVVSEALGLTLIELRHRVDSLTAGGVLNAEGRRLVVQPAALRHALVGQVYFAGPLSMPLDPVIARIPDPAETAETLLGARHRGAPVDDRVLRPLLERARDERAWTAYALLGRSEAEWVLTKLPILPRGVADAALDTAPDLVLPRLFEAAVGENRSLRNSLDHPLRSVLDWIRSAVPGTGEGLPRRAKLLDALSSWARSAKPQGIVLQAVAIAFHPGFENSELDPIQGNHVTIRFGAPTPEEVTQLSALWPKAVHLLRHPDANADWECVRHLIRDWAYPHLGTGAAPDAECRTAMLHFAERMLSDIAGIAGEDPGFASWANALATRMGWAPPCHADPVYEALFPEMDYEDPQGSFHRQAEAARGLADRWAAEPAAEVAERLIGYAAIARRSGHTWPMLDAVVARRLAERCTSARTWLRAMLDADASADVARPFLQRLVQERAPGVEGIWVECVGRESLRPMAVLLALSEQGAPESTVHEALANAAGLGDFIGTAVLRREIPDSLLIPLLRHADAAVAERTAWGLWHREPKGEIPPPLRSEWRAVIVRHMDCEYTLKEIFATQGGIAYDWLRPRVGRFNEDGHFRDDEPYASGIASLTDEQREALIDLLSRETWPREIVQHLVGGNPDLYRRLLDRQDVERLHLEPLQGHPDDAWAQLAALALDAGYSPSEVARAARGMLMSWEGNASDMWKAWVDAFQPLTKHTSPSIREIGRIGAEDAQREMEEALAKERKVAILGR